MSGIGQNNPNLGIDGLTDGRIDGLAADRDQSAIDAATRENSLIKQSIAVARPKVKELLEQMQSDPEARALVETFLLSQMVQEDSQQEEMELAALQRERQKRETLEECLEQIEGSTTEGWFLVRGLWYVGRLGDFGCSAGVRCGTRTRRCGTAGTAARPCFCVPPRVSISAARGTVRLAPFQLLSRGRKPVRGLASPFTWSDSVSHVEAAPVVLRHI